MTTEELYNATIGIKAEVLDIKEVLADYDDKIKDISNTVELSQINFTQQLNNKLSNYVSSDTLADYYNKTDINNKFKTLNYMSPSDIKQYLMDNNYVVSDDLRGYVTSSTLNARLDDYIRSFLTLDEGQSIFATKSEIEQINSNSVDLSEYATLSFIEHNFYTKDQVNNLIPSTSGFVRKSELYTLLPLDDFALTDWVNETFIKKGDIKLNNYVSLNIFNETLSEFETKIPDKSEFVTITKFNKETTELDNRISTLSETITKKYIPVILSEFKKDNELVSKSDIRGFVTKEELRDYIISDNSESNIDLSDFAKKTDLENYVLEHVLDNKISDALLTVSAKSIPDALAKFKATNEYLTLTEANHIFATKDELREYILNGSVSFDEGLLESYVKTDDLTDYVQTKTLTTDLNKTVSKITDIYIPNALTEFKVDNNLVSQTYVDRTFATKEELVKYIVESDNIIANIDFDNFTKKSDLKNYMLKSNMKDYVDYGAYTENLMTINNNISTINSSLSKFVQHSQLSEYVKEDLLNYYLNDYVTKENLLDEINKATDKDITSIDTSDFLTKSDYDRLKNYVNTSLENYPTQKDVYTKSTIDKYFMKSSEIDDNFYSKKESDTKYLSKITASEEYLSITDAYSDFLSKEDYRGIKSAMTLNGAYKNSKEIFEVLLEKSKLLDGFYIVEDEIVIVKDNKPYSSNLTGSQSYTKNEIDDMNFVTKDELTKFKNKNWIIDTGGNY